MVLAKANGAAVDQAAFDARLSTAVAETVRAQVDAGIDCVNDGELSKTTFTDYVRWRIEGYETRPWSGPRRLSIIARDETKFAGYFEANPRCARLDRPVCRCVWRRCVMLGRRILPKISVTSKRR
jgi:methionine synthase II (cobalamin-independent)